MKRGPTGSGHRLQISGGARRDLARCDRTISDMDYERLMASIDGLAAEPRPQRSPKLRAMTDIYRLRVGNFRIISLLSKIDRNRASFARFHS